MRKTTFAVVVLTLFVTAKSEVAEGRDTPLSLKDVVKLCDRHTSQSARSANFDLSILSKVRAKVDLPKIKLVDLSDSVYFLVGQEEGDCRLLALEIIDVKEFRENQAKRLETLLNLQKYREAAQKAAGEPVSAKPKNADPDSLLDELNKKLPPVQSGTATKPASFEGLSLGDWLENVLVDAKKARLRSS